MTETLQETDQQVQIICKQMKRKPEDLKNLTTLYASYNSGVTDAGVMRVVVRILQKL